MKHQYIWGIFFGILLVTSSCKISQAPKQSNTLSSAKSMKNVVIPNEWVAEREEGEADSLEEYYSFMEEITTVQLDCLIQEALTYNSTLNIAELQLEKAQSYVKIAKAKMKPVVGVGANLDPTYAYSFGTGGVQGAVLPYAFGASASWEADIWGKNRYGIESAKSSAYSQEQKNEFAKQLIASSIYHSWYALISLESQKNVVEELIVKQNELKALLEKQYEVGVLDQKHIIELEGVIADLEEQNAIIDLSILETKRAIEVLVGRFPTGSLEVKDDFPIIESEIPESFPLTLIEKRPDVLASQYMVDMAFYDMEQADAARLPSFQIPLVVGMLNNPADMLKHSIGASISPNMGAVLFAGGALKEGVKIKTKTHKQAIEGYAQAVLYSFEDMENAVSTIETNKIKLNRREKVISQLDKNYELSKVRVKVGSENMINLKLQEIEILRQDINIVALETEKILSRVDLYVAMGGDFQGDLDD